MSTSRNYIIATLIKPWNREEPEWIFSHYTRNELISRLARQPKILENLSNDMSETKLNRRIVPNKYAYGGYVINYENIYYICRIKGNSLVQVDISKLVNEINILIERESKKKEKKKLYYAYCNRQDIAYEFRKDPVPGVHNYNNCHRGSCYIHPATTKSRRNSIYKDDDYIFVDTKAKTLPTVWDDKPRHTDKSWKTSCKIKKQYMKHLDKHIDTTKVDRKNYLEETDYEE